MIITPLMQNTITENKKTLPTKQNTARNVSLPYYNTISHYPRPYLPANPVAFGGLRKPKNAATAAEKFEQRAIDFEEKVVKSVKGKKNQGAGLYTEDGKWLDFSRVGDEPLSQENLDITKASDSEIHAYWHANALRESLYSWTPRYNSFNMDKMLSTFPTLESQEAKETFKKNRIELWNFNKNKSLDVPVVDQNGKFCLDCVVFDTESTGINIYANKTKPNKTLDRIIQIGAVQVKGGKIKKGSEVSQLINPDMPIPKEATNVNGITDETVRKAPHIETFLPKFLKNYLNKENGVIVAYNGQFDLTILNNSIRRFNNTIPQDEAYKEKASHKLLDPFILMQRIHPYVNVRKKLGEQYRELYCKTMDGAHDALCDVKGTVDVVKYCVYWLADHRKDKNIPLSLREVLAFQNGEKKIGNLDIKLDTSGCNAAVNYKKSYQPTAVSVVNYFKGYHLTKSDLEDMKETIGQNNYDKIVRTNIDKKAFFLKEEDGKLLLPEEDGEKSAKNEEKFRTLSYKLRKNFQAVLGLSQIEDYNGKSKDEIISHITEQAKTYVDHDAVKIWMKNPNPADIKDGNDLPDIKITRQVMQESKEAEQAPETTAPEKPAAKKPKLVKNSSKTSAKNLKVKGNKKPAPKPRKPKD